MILCGDGVVMVCKAMTKIAMTRQHARWLVIFIFIELTCKRELALAVDWVGWYSEEGSQKAKNDTYLLISVGGIQVIHLQRDTVKPQTIIQQNVVIGTVAVDGWVVTFGTARRAKRRYLLTY